MDNIDNIVLLDSNVLDSAATLRAAVIILEEAGDDIHARMEAINEICQSFLDLHNDSIAELYISELSKKFKITKSLFKARYKTLKESYIPADETQGVTFPSEEAEMEARKIGFFNLLQKYYFVTKDGIFQASNYVIYPLVHIYSKTDNKRLIEIHNEYGLRCILDVPSQAFTSIDMFQQFVFKEGNFIFFGNKNQYLKILNSIANDFPRCDELRTLGWQREGFYAFANGIYSGVWQPVDKLGITDHEKHKFFSPAFSCVYTNVREDDDEYENDRFFIWQPSAITFPDWGKLMVKVYGEKAIIAIAFLIAAIFRDVIYEKYKIFPHLFLFGEKQSGKSQLAWSLSNVFYNNLPAFNLNSGTQVGFFRRLSRVKNSVVWFDEYTNDIEEKRFQSLKSAYDGMGHEKGKMSKDSRTEITKVNSACIISGQYLPTRDDNALFTRSILLSFEKKNYSKEETEDYEKLKSFEVSGLSSMVGEILQFREEVDVKYGMTFSDIFEKVKVDLVKEGVSFDDRLVRNFVSILAPIQIIMKKDPVFSIGFTYKQIYDISKSFIKDLSGKISSSESLATFWNMTEYLLDGKFIEDKKDFKVTPTIELSINNKHGEKETLTFLDPVKLLFIRIKNIHSLYLEHHRKQYGVSGIDKTSLEHYLRNHPAFLGTIESTKFSNQVTSAWVFKYQDVKVNLERYNTEKMDMEEPDSLPF